MPRIYAPKEDVNTLAGHVDFYNGAAAVDEDATHAIAFFTAARCGIDNSKHELTVLDKLTREQVDQIAAYLGIALDPDDGKMDVIRDIEDAISTHYIGAITPTSAAHDTEVGQTTVTMAAVAGQGNTLYYKTGVTAPAPLYGDKVDSTWTEFTSPVSFKPTATHLHITTVEAVTATGFILKSGTDELAVKT